ncbi:MAG: hypothetical protein ACPF9D_01185 [Owenweeksia sp.]
MRSRAFEERTIGKRSQGFNTFASMSTLITNISALLHIDQQGRKWKRGRELGDFPTTVNAWLLADNGFIKDYGIMSDGLPEHSDTHIDAQGGMLLPTWTDSHTHLVYAGTREDELCRDSGTRRWDT